MVNKRVKEAVDENNIVHLVDAFTNIILKDKRFDTTEFEESLAYARSQMGDNIFQPFDGEPEKPESEWSIDYWNDQLSALQDNFCSERIDRMKKLGCRLYKKEEPVRRSSYSYGRGIGAKKKYQNAVRVSKRLNKAVNKVVNKVGDILRGGH